MSNGDIVIDESNFNDYFTNIKKNPPKKGQVLARFSAIAELVNGFPKDQIVRMLLTNPKGGDLAPQILRNICNATEPESIRLSKEIAVDLASGMSEEDVLNKPYEYTIEIFYWTNEECVPKNSPNWVTIKMLNEIENSTNIVDGNIKISISVPELDRKNDDAC